MHQDHASLGYGLVNEPARSREVDKEIQVVDVIDWYPKLLDPASRMISWDGVRANRHDVGDPSLRQCSRSPSSDQTIRRKEDVSRTEGLHRRGEGGMPRTFPTGACPR